MLVGQRLPWHTVHMNGAGTPSRGLCSMKEGGKAFHRWLCTGHKGGSLGLGKSNFRCQTRGHLVTSLGRWDVSWAWRGSLRTRESEPPDLYR